MKKVFVLMMVLAVTIGSQAQIGNLVGRAVKKKLEQTVEQKVENALGVKNQDQAKEPEATEKNEPKTSSDKNRIPTPEEVMGMVPQLPSPQQLADYSCEKNRANPRTLKMVANPTTAFLAKMVAASASGYVVTMNGSNPGGIYTFDEQLLKEFGITQEQYDAMSEEEQQQLSIKYASELQDRYLRTAERLASDEGYNRLMEEYSKIEDEINTIYSQADEQCRTMWEKTYGNNAHPNENDVCSYFNQTIPIQYKAVIEVMKIRKTRQLNVAKKMDDYVQDLAKRHPNEIYPGFYNQGGICATSYVSDAARLTTLSDPR